ncbi:MAG: glycosyltransferase family 9 protein [candidate division Zixibacteria bacterium]|nr:glycosyltransferase family 9 protein [candidate division Zixibacteria bacterium]
MRKELEKKGKSFLIEILRFFLKNRPISDRVDLSSIKKILVIRQDDRIGNPILVTPLLIALRKKFSQAKISFLASAVSAELFSGFRLVDELLVLEKKRYIRNPLAFLLNIFKLRRKRFDLAFDCSDENTLSFGHGMWIYLSGAKYRIGHKRDRSDLFLNIEVPPVDYTRHATDMHLDLLRFLIPERSEELPFLEVKREEEKYIEDYLEKMGINFKDFLVGINLGGTGKKKWGFENFIELGNRLKRENVKVIYTWGPQEKYWIKNLNNTEVLTEILPLPKLSALLKRCNLFISSDSGIMHLSTAVGTPTLAIFVHSNPLKFGPKGKKDRTISSMDGEVGLSKVLEVAEKMIEELSGIKRNKIKAM